jgi:ABC-2 type transport system ATP-binding protein
MGAGDHRRGFAGRTRRRSRYDPGVIELTGVSRFFRGKAALRNVSFRARPGAALALLGDNGAGKSTLLSTIVGNARPDEGTATIDGADPRAFSTRRRVAYLPETDALEPYLTVDEAVRFLLDLYGVRAKKAADVEPVLKRFGLSELRRRRVATLSKGQRRRLEIARTVVVDPPYWVFDEPDSGLDPAGLRLLRAEIRVACARGRCVVFSTHALFDVAAADEVACLRRGELVFFGTRADLAARVEARGYVVFGDDAADAAFRKAALDSGVALEGPEPAWSALDAFLAADEKP